jgi:hypothetical protein
MSWYLLSLIEATLTNSLFALFSDTRQTGVARLSERFWRDIVIYFNKASDSHSDVHRKIKPSKPSFRLSHNDFDFQSPCDDDFSATTKSNQEIEKHSNQEKPTWILR